MNGVPVAFYAPLKPPTHPTASGDRALARGLMRAAELAGYAPELASALRLLDLTGDRDAQLRLQTQAADALPDIIAAGKRSGWRLWMTYHNYYKAPDLLGPSAAKALDIPYVQVESTRAAKRLSGPWAEFARAAEDAADAADAICYYTQRDAQALRAHAPSHQLLVHLRPFLPLDALPPQSDGRGAMLTAAMMRPGDKLASYQLIADALPLIDADWRLDIAGDGTARAKVEAMMTPFGSRVRFLGALDADGMAQAYAHARALLWPGLRDVLAPGNYPSVASGAAGLAQAADWVLATHPDPNALRIYTQDNHLLPAAARTLGDVFSQLIGGGA